jgi:UDP-N-acetylmuramoyl-tripeptide--D-alanyl-D-alanine ligase
MARRLSAVAERIGGRLSGGDASFGAVVTDTRSLPPGSLFVAIRGERFDGNAFVSAAAGQGAVGAIVSERQDVALPQIEVNDTRRAFGGSAGKTTVKELIGSVLGMSGKVCMTEGNLNNDIGVPLSLMRLEPDDEAMVVELGANHAGEIANLGSLVEPTVAVITNAGPAHLEGFGSIAGVAAAKGELIDSLGTTGVAVLNADDDYFDEWRERAGSRRVVSFGWNESADVRPAGDIVSANGASRFTLAMPAGGHIDVRLALLGRANVANALAAAAAAHAAGSCADDIRRGLEAASAVKGRMRQLAGLRGATLIDDSYNANPSAARAALDYLAGCNGRRIFVLGDMLELGDDTRQLHREVGEYAASRCDELIAVGDLSREAADAFGSGATPLADIDAAAAVLRKRMSPDVTVLIKASRSIGLDRLVAALGEDAPPC